MAGGRPIGVGHPTYSSAAATLLDNGYEPLPIVPAKKQPPMRGWSSIPIDARQVEDWVARYPDHGVGLRTGQLVGLDIDILDADLAHEIQSLAIRRLGDSFVRVGRWPKRLLLYRTDHPAPKRAVGKVEVLGAGQQLVAFGVHPDTGQPYSWTSGDSPLDVHVSDLPSVDDDAIAAFLAEAGALQPDAGQSGGSRPRRSSQAAPNPGHVTREGGLVVDGRDGWLSTIAFHAVHDASDAEITPDLDDLAAHVWDRFSDTTDLTRLRQDSGRGYDLADARRKVADKLRLLSDGRLPERAPQDAPPPPECPTKPVESARAALDQTIHKACTDILGWHRSGMDTAPPRIGIRATVGLGKTTLSRRHLLALRAVLKQEGLPHRIAIFTPSLALAEEAAEGWQGSGLTVAVLRGYEALQPVSRDRMCIDIEAVRLALTAGADIQKSVCDDGKGNRCAHIQGCAKQANRRDVAGADIVIAAYDALFTGFSNEHASIGLLVIDEGCWARAIEKVGITIDTLEQDMPDGFTARSSDRWAGLIADLRDLRLRLSEAVRRNGPGALRREAIVGVLTAEDCTAAAELEHRRMRDLGLRPGAAALARQAMIALAQRNEMVRRHTSLWQALAAFLDTGAPVSGRVRALAGPDGAAREIVPHHARPLHKGLRQMPVLHLDATLRSELASTVLPGLRTTTISADAPHMHLTLVPGRFGKSALIEDTQQEAPENARRRRNLATLVEHVAWQARRVAPGRTLVVTYKDCEDAFFGIPDVETAHFNALAGLDCWGDVALLIVIGRPLPSDSAVSDLAGAFFDAVPEGRYTWGYRSVAMRRGDPRLVRTLAHPDVQAETLRAAICDDELIQAIGRGRGVNRIAGSPLEVQVLADVALPLKHDALVPWELARPDLMQRMLLNGIAVDSPADAALLHPQLFTGAEQAKKEFQRGLFKGQTPMNNTYRGMSLKSAAYRRAGRGRSWATAWWIDGNDEQARQRLASTLGSLGGWKLMTD